MSDLFRETPLNELKVIIENNPSVWDLLSIPIENARFLYKKGKINNRTLILSIMTFDTLEEIMKIYRFEITSAPVLKYCLINVFEYLYPIVSSKINNTVNLIFRDNCVDYKESFFMY